MKSSFALSALALAATANAHAIMQKIKVAGVDQGQLVAVRAPPNNNPVQDVTSSNLICGAAGETSSQVITIPAGSSVAGAWAHSLGGPQGANDADNPIAASHHGPAQVYLASVSDASSASQTGLSWFKIASNSITSAGVWGVDAMRAAVDSQGFGWQEFTMPSCIAPGNYLMRVELIALHGASSSGGAQFYQSCAQIKVRKVSNRRGCSMQVQRLTANVLGHRLWLVQPCELRHYQVPRRLLRLRPRHPRQHLLVEHRADLQGAGPECHQLRGWLGRWRKQPASIQRSSHDCGTHDYSKDHHSPNYPCDEDIHHGCCSHHHKRWQYRWVGWTVRIVWREWIHWTYYLRVAVHLQGV